MPITVNSPYSGRPVKVRDADLGRAIRDEEGRIFYVVQREGGDGYYAAPTRKGSAKDEQRYDDMAAKMAVSDHQVQAQAAAVHDATGRRRSRPALRLVLILLLLAVVAAGLYLYFVGLPEGLDLPGTGDDAITPTDPLDLPTPGPPQPSVLLWPPTSDLLAA